MKVVTILGTRPEIIRLSRVIPNLDQLCEHTVVHTGQNHDPNLSDVFFKELGLRAPDTHLGIKTAEFAEQLGLILRSCAEVLERIRPDRVLILGDTNSGLASLVAARMGLDVYHMEAGNRCYDDRVPEEVNRRVIDHCSAVLMPYTYRSKENLVREGIDRSRIFVIGNPIFEVLKHYQGPIERSTALETLGVSPQSYFLVTLHRAENVNQPARLEGLLRGLSMVAEAHERTMVVSLHPRTADKLRKFGLEPESGRIRFLPPLGFFDFVNLEKNARCVLSDSGTVQEECCILGVPNVTLRDVTERPETMECGSNVLTGGDPATILRSVELAMSEQPQWIAPPEYVRDNVSGTVAKILLGYRDTRRTLH